MTSDRRTFLGASLGIATAVDLALQRPDDTGTGRIRRQPSL